MKRHSYFLTLLIAFLALPSTGQNIQLHYDLGHAFYGKLSARPKVTSTVEFFKPDKLGSNYFFIDIDYFTDGAAGAYWEISREFAISHNKQWALHIEYNGGVTSIKKTAVATRFQHALLAGAAWNWTNSNFNKSFSVQVLYKYYFRGMERADFNGFQLTTVWSNSFADGKCTFSGFTDLWYDKDVNGKLIFLSEPQFWVNLNAFKGLDGVNLSLGTELELSHNFVFDKNGNNNKFYAIPTIAGKWTF